MQAPNGQPLQFHRRNTFIVEFVATIKSTIELAHNLLTMQDNPFKYFLTYTFSKDHIELLFSCIRGRGGWNNSPNALQRNNALRKLLLRNNAKASNCANCQIFEKNSTIPVFKTKKHQSALVEQNDNENQEEDQAVEGMIDKLDDMKHSEFVGNILFYIAGFAVLKLQKKRFYTLYQSWWFKSSFRFCCQKL